MPIKISEFSIRDCLVIHYFPVNKVPMVTGILTSLNEAGHWLTRWLQSWQPSFSPNNNYMNFEFIVYPSEGGREGERERESVIGTVTEHIQLPLHNDVSIHLAH